MIWLLVSAALVAEAVESRSAVANPEQITGLLKQLGAPSYKARQEASEALVAMGPGVLSHMRHAVPESVLEVRRRLELCIAKIEARPHYAEAKAELVEAYFRRAYFADVLPFCRGKCLYKDFEHSLAAVEARIPWLKARLFWLGADQAELQHIKVYAHSDVIVARRGH
jgi:hypothetical protein